MAGPIRRSRSAASRRFSRPSDSDRSGASYGIPDFAADVVSFLDAIAIERATLVGHSFGSFVARRVAISHPERVKGWC
jgi:non-heme chloroperoxidase